MQTVASLIQSLSTSSASPTSALLETALAVPSVSEPPPSRPRASSALLENLWERLMALYGHTWASQYGREPEGIAGETWASALAGLTGRQMAEGLRACVAEGAEFPPSAPRFRAMCLGIPTLERMRLEVREQQISGAKVSAFTRAVWQALDGWAFRNADSREAERMLRDAYAVTREAVMRGAELPPEPVAAIAVDEPKPFTPAKEETVRAAMAAIDALFRASGRAGEGEAGSENGAA